jgi:Phage baseplate assembly protein W
MAVIRGWNFPINIDKDTGRIMSVEDNENIKQSIRIILLTQLNERKLLPRFGTNVRSFLFDVIDPTFINDLKQSITDSLKRWEMNINSLHVSVNTDEGSTSKIVVNIDYITNISPNQERLTHKISLNN